MKALQMMLVKLKNDTIVDIKIENFEEYSYLSPSEVIIELSSKTAISFSYWRLIEQSGTLSFFDHNQRYEQEKTIDAYAYLVSALKGKKIEKVDIESETGDLIIRFENLKIQIFKLNSYENWILRFADGSEEYSNYIDSRLAYE